MFKAQIKTFFLLAILTALLLGIGQLLGGINGLIIAGIFGGAFWWWYSNKIFNQKIRVFGMVGNTPMEKWTDKAKYLRLGNAGDRIFFLRKIKRHLPEPKIQGGINTWYYWQREDGELINIGFPNVDLIQKKMGIKFIDTDMRMERLGIAKNLQFRHQKEGFWGYVKLWEVLTGFINELKHPLERGKFKIL